MNERTAIRTMLWLAFAAFAVGCSAGTSVDRGGSTHGVGSPTAVDPGGSAPSNAPASLPACVPVATPAPIPSAFPSEFPFPPGSVVTSAGETHAGGLYAEGYAPMGLDDARRFFVESVPASGFRLVLWEQEVVEADGHFRGHGVTGTWIVVTAQDCPEAVYFSIGTYPQE